MLVLQGFWTQSRKSGPQSRKYGPDRPLGQPNRPLRRTSVPLPTAGNAPCGPCRNSHAHVRSAGARQSALRRGQRGIGSRPERSYRREGKLWASRSSVCRNQDATVRPWFRTPALSARGSPTSGRRPVAVSDAAEPSMPAQSVKISLHGDLTLPSGRSPADPCGSHPANLRSALDGRIPTTGSRTSRSWAWRLGNV